MNIGKIPAKTARLAPTREALIDISASRRMTFGELEERVCRLGNALMQQLGLAKGDRVAVLARNCIEYMEVYYGCARVGLIVQPLNWRLGAPELLKIASGGEPAVLMYAAEYADEAATLVAQAGIPHAFAFGEDSDGSYEALLAQASAQEPVQSASTG